MQGPSYQLTVPQYQAPGPDPEVTILDQNIQQQQTDAAKNEAQIDTASLMARYGTRLAMAGGTTSPLVGTV